MGAMCAPICGACCLSEGEQVDAVLEKFPAITVSQAYAGCVNRVVGRCMLAGTQGFYSPISNQPCVYFRLRIERKDYYTDEEGERHERWELVKEYEQCMDFYLQDGVAQIFVQGSAAGLTKISSQTICRQVDYANPFQAPVGLSALMQQNPMSGFNMLFSGETEYRYFEAVFSIGEPIACLCTVNQAQNPWTGQPILMAAPISEDVMTPEYQEQLGWSELDQECWEYLFARGPQILLSDNAGLTAGFAVPMLQNLPPYMTSYQADMSFYGQPQYNMGNSVF